VEAMVQVVDDVHQTDGVDVEHSGGVGIVAHFRRIASNANQVADAECAGAQQVRLNAQYITIAAGIVQNRLDGNLGRGHQAQCLVAETCRSAWAIGNVDRVHTHGLQVARTFDFPGSVDTLRRNDLDHDYEFSVGDLAAKVRALLYRGRLHRTCHRLRFRMR